MNFEFIGQADLPKRRIHYTIVVDETISSCGGCPALGSHSGQGETWDECRHPAHPAFPNNILDRKTPFPEWCPAQEKQS